MPNLYTFRIFLTVCTLSAGIFIANQADAKCRKQHDVCKKNPLEVRDLKGHWTIDTQTVGQADNPNESYRSTTRLLSFKLNDSGLATNAYISIVRYSDESENLMLEETFDGVVTVIPKAGLANGFNFNITSEALNFSMRCDFLIQSDLDKTHPGQQTAGINPNCEVAKASLNRR